MKLLLWIILHGLLIIDGKEMPLHIGELDIVRNGLKKIKQQIRNPRSINYQNFNEKCLNYPLSERNTDIITELMSKDTFNSMALDKIEPRAPLDILYHKTLQKYREFPKKSINAWPQYQESSLGQMFYPLKSNLIGNTFNEVPIERNGRELLENLKVTTNVKIDNNGNVTKKEFTNEGFPDNKFSIIVKRGNLTNTEPKPIKNKTDLIKILLATYPLQVCLLGEGLFNRCFDRKVSSKNSDCPNNLSSEFYRRHDIVNDKGYKEAGFDLNKTLYNVYLNELMDFESPIENKKMNVFGSPSNSLPRNVIDSIHQPAEETVFKSNRNQVRQSPSCNNLSESPLNTVQAIEFIKSVFKDSNLMYDMNHSKSKLNAVEAVDNKSTIACNDDCPRMKIRVRNGPIVLTFQSDTTEKTTKRTEEKDPLIIISKITNDKKSNKSSALSQMNSLIGEFLTGLTEEAGSECNQDLINKHNNSCYYTGALEGHNPSQILNSLFKISNNYNNRNVTKIGNKEIVLISKSINQKSESSKTIAATTNVTEPKEQIDLKKQSNDSLFLTSLNSFKNGLSFNDNNLITSESPYYAQNINQRLLTNPITYGKLNSPITDMNLKSDNSFLKNYEPRFNNCDKNFNPSQQSKLQFNNDIISKEFVGLHPDNNFFPPFNDTMKKIEMLKILKLYLDTLSSQK